MHVSKTLQIKITNARLWKREYFQPYGTNWTKKWLPRHMKGRNAANINSQVQKVNCVIEVVDARLPLSSRNYNFSAQGRAPRLVLFNKADLANLTSAEKKYFTNLELESAEAVVWGSANEEHPSLLPELIEQVVKITRRWRSERGTIECLISGIPNTGKSTLINNLRRTHIEKNINQHGVCLTGDAPAITRKLSERILVHESPRIFVRDTPGVYSFEDVARIKQVALAAGNLFPIDLIPDGYIQVADYIQYILNQRECWDHYTKFASLSLPSDSINTLLTAICEKYQLYHDPVELLNRHMDSGKSVEISRILIQTQGLLLETRRGPLSPKIYKALF